MLVCDVEVELPRALNQGEAVWDTTTILSSHTMFALFAVCGFREFVKSIHLLLILIERFCFMPNMEKSGNESVSGLESATSCVLDLDF